MFSHLHKPQGHVPHYQGATRNHSDERCSINNNEIPQKSTRLKILKAVGHYFRSVLRARLGGAIAAGAAGEDPDSGSFLAPLPASPETLTFLPPRVESVF